MKLRPRPYSNNPDNYLWIDLPDAEARLSEVSPDLRGQVGDFIRDGYVILPQRHDESRTEAVVDAIHRAVESGSPAVHAQYKAPPNGWKTGQASLDMIAQPSTRVLDPHHTLPDALGLSLAPQLVDFLRACFGEDVVAFQSLYFEYGSTQKAHNDTAFVQVSPPDKLIASWTALEDIAPGTGELFFYPRSHQIGDQIFDDGSKRMSPKDSVHGKYGPSLEVMMDEHGLERATFRARRGETLFWAANLIHGGTEIVQHRTRRSLVTHYCPLSATVPYAKRSGIAPQPYAPGAWYMADR